MNKNLTDIQQDLIDFIGSELVGDRLQVELKADDDLLSESLLDSMGVMRLVEHIERQYDMDVPPMDVTIENFISVEKISSYVTSRLTEHGNAAG